MSGDGRIDIPAWPVGERVSADPAAKRRYSAAWTYTGGGTATGLAIGDFNNDGAADLTIPNSTSNNVGSSSAMGTAHFSRR